MSALERIQQRKVVDTALAEYCAKRTVNEVVLRFAELGLPATRVNQPTDLATEPHVHERDLLIPTQLADGTTIPLVGPAAKFSKTPLGIRNHAPTLGQNTDAIMRELGISDDLQAKLREAGVIK